MGKEGAEATTEDFAHKVMHRLAHRLRLWTNLPRLTQATPVQISCITMWTKEEAGSGQPRLFLIHIYIYFFFCLGAYKAVRAQESPGAVPGLVRHWEITNATKTF